MSYLGDIRTSATRIDFGFTTVNGTGDTTALTNASVGVFRQNAMETYAPAGAVLSVGTGNFAGLNVVTIFPGSASSYFVAGDYTVVLMAGSVGTINVRNQAVRLFSIENRSALMPTTAGRNLDVSAGGEAGIDWSNIGSPTTAQNLSATSIGGVASAVSINWGLVVNAGSTVNLAATTVNLVNTATTVTSVGAVGLVNGSIGGNVLGSVLGSVATVTSLGAVGVVNGLTADARNTISDSLLARNIEGGSSTGRTVTSTLQRMRNRVVVSGGTGTVYANDDSTTAWTFAITTTGAVSIASVDPS